MLKVFYFYLRFEIYFGFQIRFLGICRNQKKQKLNKGCFYFWNNLVGELKLLVKFVRVVSFLKVYFSRCLIGDRY